MRGSCLKTSIADRRVSLMLSGDMSQWRTSRPVTKAGGIKRLGPPSGTYALRGARAGLAERRWQLVEPTLDTNLTFRSELS